MMRVADYVTEALANHGISHVFLVTGGGAMHLNDAFGRNRQLNYVCCHHEQACAIAAESYGRLLGRPAALNVTTGPGGVNAMNGVYGAYVDSVPMVVVSGQVKRETLARNYPLPLRQLGDQEVDIVRMVEPITKYAVVVQNPADIRYEMERAIHLANSGRPGPVWIDIPIDVQAAPIDPTTLRGFDPTGDDAALAAVEAETGLMTGATLATQLDEIVARLAAAKRPVVLAGAGVRLSGMHEAFLAAIDRMGIPVTSGWNAHDVIWDDHPLYVGRPGTVGDRPGNFAVQNADFVLILGSRLNIRQISYNWKSFARAAYKVMVDIDSAELRKPTLTIDQPVHADLREFLPGLIAKLGDWQIPADHTGYLEWCRARHARYPTVLPEYWEASGVVNPYCFADSLFRQLQEDEIVVTADGTACVVTFQAAALKRGQRLYTNSGCASMGYDLPAAIGAWHAARPDRLVCIAGDGSIMMNLQELQTIGGQKLPIKIFILNNNGYHSIRQTQQAYFPDNVVGCGPESGLTFPDFLELAKAFGIPARRCSDHADLEAAIQETLQAAGPQICEIILDPKQAFAPKLASRRLEDGSMVSSPLEDLAPFLPRDEFAENMLIDPAS